MPLLSDSKSNRLENDITSHLFGGPTVCARPTEWWLALYATNPTDALTASSPVAVTALMEMSATSSDPVWTITNNEATNSYAIQFPPVPVSEVWIVSHFALFDSANSARPLYHGAFKTTKQLQEGDVFIIAPGQLIIREF